VSTVFDRYLQAGHLIRLTTSGSEAFVDHQGYVGEVTDHDFEFLVVTNAYEHFSNISADPQFRIYRIPKSDIVNITE
jgi:hypothetical protein